MAEGGALQAGRLWRQRLSLHLEGVAERPGAQAVQGLDADPAKGVHRSDWNGSALAWLRTTPQQSIFRRSFFPLYIYPVLKKKRENQ